MTSRLTALAERLERPLLVTDLVNVRYLTGLDASNAAVVVRPGGDAVLYTDFRYAAAARALDEDIPVEIVRSSLVAELAQRLDGPLGFEAEALPYGQYEVLAGGALELVPTKKLVEELRVVKDDEEIAALARAARVADRAFEALTAETWVGRSEKELAWRLRELLHAHGADDLSFDTIVASGPRGALPHAHPTNTIIETRTLVTVDWGARVGGYCSDCTRTLSTGSLPDRLRELYEVCLAAQTAAVASIRPGMSGVDADRAARDPIEAAGLGNAFGHGLGHGVGLDIHEAPRLSRESTDTLEAGQVVTVEPGIYVEGLGGVRIEDMCVVRADGLESLTSFPKALVEVG